MRTEKPDYSYLELHNHYSIQVSDGLHAGLSFLLPSRFSDRISSSLIHLPSDLLHKLTAMSL